MNKEQLKNILSELGFKADRFGHMQKVLKDGIKLRVKFQAISVRYEFKPIRGSQWFLRSSAYLKDVKVMDDGKLVIGRYALGKPKN